MKSFKELTEAVKFDTGAVYQQVGKKDVLKFSHVGTSSDIGKQSLIFIKMMVNKGVAQVTGKTLSLMPDEVKKTGKMFVKIPGPVKEFEIK
jgi:hypothetical protein